MATLRNMNWVVWGILGCTIVGAGEEEAEGEAGLAPAPTEEGRGMGSVSAKMPTGRVVGIIKRNWRPYRYLSPI